MNVIRMTVEEHERHQARVKGVAARECPEQPKRNEIVLPWPPSVLSPNARLHWAVRAKTAKHYREHCFVATKLSKVAIDWDGEIHLWLTFYPPDRRRRDDDNAIASFKAGRDGVAEALGVDDSRFRLHPWVSDELGGKVVVRLTRGPEA